MTMLVSIAIMILLVLVVFGFVLEPILRARRDRLEYEEDVTDETIPDFRALIADYENSGPADEEQGEHPVSEGRALESQS